MKSCENAINCINACYSCIAFIYKSSFNDEWKHHFSDWRCKLPASFKWEEGCGKDLPIIMIQ